MIARWLLLFLLPLSLAWAQTSRADDGRWGTLAKPPPRMRGGERDLALVVSIERYQALPAVEGAGGIGAAWTQWFRKTRGLTDERVAWLSDAQATTAGILASAQALGALADPKGRIWVVFVGYGAAAEDGTEGALVDWATQPTAPSPFAGSLRVSELVAALGGGAKAPITLVIDASFNARGRFGETLAQGVHTTLARERAKPLPANVTMLLAARGDEFAGLVPIAALPAFSYLVLGGLYGWADDKAAGYGNGDRRVTGGEALAYTAEVLGHGLSQRTQTPQAEGPLGDVLVKGVRAAALISGEMLRTPERTPDGFVRVEPGTFMMGSPESELGHRENETQREVHITRPFFLQETEVSVKDWVIVMHDNPRFSPCGDCPFTEISWLDAVRYLNTLSQRAGLAPCYQEDGTFAGLACPGYRLPTEAEWEYAARAGSTGATHVPLDEVAHLGGDPGFVPAPGNRMPNAWGLYDMLGSVREWVNDWYAPTPAAGDDPTGPSTGTLRGLRGGYWTHSALQLRYATRSRSIPDQRSLFNGFRAARSVVP